ncbi:hypothetical protein SMY46_004242 [Cronobacter turicensis]|nr:hypothetical protein [Cronobacter turicensis]ELY4112500.1 hypothetical protein [Cronobacter turicensis]
MSFKFIKIFGRVVILGSFFFTASVQAAKNLSVQGPIPKSIISWVEGLRLESVSLEYGVLTAIYKDEKVSKMMADTVAEGICQSRFTEEPKWSNNLINKVIVLNHWKMQGFEYALSAKACDEYGNTAGDDSKKFIDELTKPYP